MLQLPLSLLQSLMPLILFFSYCHYYNYYCYSHDSYNSYYYYYLSVYDQRDGQQSNIRTLVINTNGGVLPLSLLINYRLIATWECDCASIIKHLSYLMRAKKPSAS